MMALGPRAAAHRTKPRTAVKAAVQLPRYYDGNMTQYRDPHTHPEDPSGTYRIITHFDACQQFTSDPSVRLSMPDADLVADGLMPRNAFANPVDWEEAVTNAKTRICDYYTLYWTGTGAPAQVAGTPTSSARQPNDPPNPDCWCVRENYDTQYQGFAAEGMVWPHVAQYGYTWVEKLSGAEEWWSAASLWVGGSGLFTINGEKGDLTADRGLV